MVRFVATVLIGLAFGAQALADNWPGWRGPDANGVAPAGDYPTEWSNDKNIAWKVSLPGRGASTPIVWQDQIILTCGIDGRNAVVALDRDGKQLWQTSIGDERTGKHKKATGANPSAVTDGQNVFVYFKSGDLACLDLAGKVSWQHNVQQMYGEDTLWWDLGTSPVLTKDFVVVTVMQTGPSYLAAFDKTTGKLVWKQDRLLDAPLEAAQSYTTPVVVEQNGQELLVVLGADHVTAHDVTSGQEVWRVGGLNPNGEKYYRSIASPVVSNGLVIAPYARGKTLTAIRLGGTGDVTKSHVAWTRDDVGADVPTPIAIDGKVYVCGDKGEVSCLDIATGKTLWSGQTPRNRNAFSSSPILTDGKLYVTREDGKTFVLAQGDEFKILAENSLEAETVVATPVFTEGKILIRTPEQLVCIGK